MGNGFVTIMIHPKVVKSKHYFQTIVEYGNIILTEIDCFVITVSKQIEHQMGQCRTIYDVLDGTMTYFCNFLVGPMVRKYLFLFFFAKYYVRKFKIENVTTDSLT